MFRAFLLVLPAMAFSTLGHAQSNQNFDGGTGIWDAGITPDWDGTNVWTADNQATFNSNTVTVSGTVEASAIEFGGATTTISGGTINLDNPSGYTNIQSFTGGGLNSNPVSITSQIELGASGPDIQYFITNYSNSDLSFGNIDWSLATPSDGRFQLSGNDNGGSITLAGAYTTSGTGGGSITFGNNGQGTYNLASTADFSTFNNGLTDRNQQGNSFGFIGDVLNIATSKFSGNQTMAFYNANSGNLVNIQGAQNIVLSIYNSQKNSGPDDGDGVSDIGQMIFNQSTADESHWSGPGGVNANGSNLTLEAVAGGRLDWDIGNQGSMALGLTINPNASNTGVVVLSSNASNYGLQDGNGILHASSTTAATLAHGTILITNTAGSAFGNNAGTVKLMGGAKLGGSGISTEMVVAVDSTSIIAPGLLASGPTTLHLNGGLTTNGLTVNFTLSGTSTDTIDFGGSYMNLNGTVTFNFAGVPVISAANGNGIYKILTGLNLDETNENSGTYNLVFNAPAGYTVKDWNTVSGPSDPVTSQDGGQDYIYVQFAAVATPEPSTYALMGLGLLALVTIRRFRRMNA